MAHRRMPKPDPAGRLFPVEPTPAPNIPQPPLLTTPKSKSRNVRDYWEIILAVLVIAATIFVGWRIAEITLSRSKHPQSKTAPVNSAPANASIPITTGKTQIPTSPDNSLLQKPAPHQEKPQTNQTSNDPVVIQAIVGIDGKVKQAKVLRGNAKLASAALETVRQLSFNPYAPNGTAVEFETEVVVSQPSAHKNPNENLQISIPQQPATQQTIAP